MSKRISYYTIVSAYFLAFVAFIMYLVMDTAKDRGNYIKHFENPFGDSRIEIGFQYYMQAFNFFNLPATVSIIITCVIIYFFLSRVWFRYVKTHWLISILLFNFFAFGLMNYYLGTSIRMGLAIGLALYSSVKILEGSKYFWLLLPLSFFIHYGAILYIVVFIWVYLFKNRNLMFHSFIVLIGTLGLLAVFNFILPLLGLSSYYMQYFESDFGRTDRLIPFTILFSLISLFLITVKFNKLFYIYPVISILVIYSIPFLVFQLATGNPLFGKMLMPIIFIQSIALSYLYSPMMIKNFSVGLFIALVFVLNVFAILYALKMYQFI